MEWRRLILPFFILASVQSVSRILATELPQGQIIERVMCEADANQTYALYLPSNYTPEKKWPILYAFDAGARGHLPVERFKEAAEKYGYIVAGSNNSRNGPLEPTVVAIRALLQDTQARFSIDPQRLYLTGFSGGARVAVSVGYSLKGLAAGVIGCGAGFPSESRPSPSIPFAYFGTVGLEDFNFPEMKQLDQTLDSIAAPHRLAIFEGGHDWPPSDVCTMAIEWMEVEAIKSGKREKNPALIDEVFHRAAAKARAAESSNKPYEAFLEYKALVRDFAGLKDVSEYDIKVEQLKNSKEIKQALKKETDQEDSQNRLSGRLLSLRETHRSGKDQSSATQELDELISGLKRAANKKENTADRLVARRVLNSFLLRLNQEATYYFQTKNYRLAAFNLSLAVQIKPESPGLQFNLACAYAQDGQRKEAMGALQKAVENGFTDVVALEKDPDLEPLRKEATFQKMVESLRKKW